MESNHLVSHVRKGLEFLKSAKPFRVMPIIGSSYWDRTSDLHNVNVIFYR